MLKRLIVTAVLFACCGWAVADNKDAKSPTSGPPPGKGWRKNETPAQPTAKEPAKPTAKAPTTPAPKSDDGIGPIVSKWATSGIHGRELAAKIHQLQAARAKAPAQPPTKPTEQKPEPPPIKKKPKAKKDSGD